MQKDSGKINNALTRRTRLALILAGIFLLFDFGAGIYHITHGGGWVSGTIEIFFGCVIAVLVYMTFIKRQGRDSDGRLKHYRTALMVISGAIALTLLVLSIYHFTHDGLPSGIVELMLSCVLVTSGWILK